LNTIDVQHGNKYRERYYDINKYQSLINHIKTDDSVLCGKVLPVQAHDRQVCIIQEPKNAVFTHFCSIMPEQNCTIFAVERPSM